MNRKQRTDTFTYKLLSIKEGTSKAIVRETPDAAFSLTVLASSLNKRKGRNFSCTIDKDDPRVVIVTANPL
ncbi:MAG TPA: hypothetical protein DDW85_06015 [Porphyromonadaceae bacterium]|nr:hypothetical protein [Porphyromonadaceae bacterium]